MMKICVPSLGRAGNSSTLKLLEEYGLLEDTYVFVYDFDYDAYSTVYPKANVIKVGTEKNLPKKRNKILDYAQQQGWKYILMLDDDVKGMIIKSNEGQYKKTEDYRVIWHVFEDIANQLNGEFTILSPRVNFLYTDPLKQLLSPYNHFSAIIFFNIEKLGELRYNDSLIEDVDLFIKLNFAGQRSYQIKHCMMGNAMGQKGGLQDYIKLKDRYDRGMEQIRENYKDADEFVYFTKRGFLGVSQRNFKKYMQLNYPDYYMSEDKVPQIKNIFDSLDIEEHIIKHRERKENDNE